MAFLRCYGIPVVMALVACTQFTLVQTRQLVSWRGGGFGMYASFHPRHHEVWVTRTDTGETTRYQKYDQPNDPVRRAVRPCLTWPNAEQAAESHRQLPEELRAVTRIDVYRLNLEPQTSELTRVLLASAGPSAEGGAP